MLDELQWHVLVAFALVKTSAANPAAADTVVAAGRQSSAAQLVSESNRPYQVAAHLCCCLYRGPSLSFQAY